MNMIRHIRRRIALISVVAIIAITLAACTGAAGPSASPGPTSRDLDGSTWRAFLLRDVPPVAGAEPTIAFTGREAGGTTGCNSYGGSFTLASDGAFAFGAVMMTEMACDGPRGAQEGIVMDILSHADHLEITAEGNLRMSGPAGSMVFAENSR